MPTYCYEHPKTKEIHEEIFSMGKAPKYIKVDGVKCKRNMVAEFSTQRRQPSANWPMYSSALAVHPTQREEYAKFSQEQGVPTHFDERGRPEFRTKKHRKKYAELVGATDFNGGCGDPQGATE